jgi:WhiB family transcriptional regulator, redox-sensing transcriptional regulator
MNVPRSSSGQAMGGQLLIKSMPSLRPWIRRARCASSTSADFFPPHGKADAAKAVCAACPVRQECLEHAMAVPEESGVWGGLDEDERKTLARHRRRSPSTGSAALPDATLRGRGGKAREGSARLSAAPAVAMIGAGMASRPAQAAPPGRSRNRTAQSGRQRSFPGSGRRGQAPPAGLSPLPARKTSCHPGRRPGGRVLRQCLRLMPGGSPPPGPGYRALPRRRPDSLLSHGGCDDQQSRRRHADTARR